MPIIPLLISIIAGVAGNLLIKIGSAGLSSNPLSVLTSPLTLAGIALLVASFPFYSQVIQKLPLSVAFPLITSSSFILLVIVSYLVLKEPLTLVNLFGMLLLIAGLFLVAQR